MVAFQEIENNRNNSPFESMDDPGYVQDQGPPSSVMLLPDVVKTTPTVTVFVVDNNRRQEILPVQHHHQHRHNYQRAGNNKKQHRNSLTKKSSKSQSCHDLFSPVDQTSSSSSSSSCSSGNNGNNDVFSSNSNRNFGRSTRTRDDYSNTSCGRHERSLKRNHPNHHHHHHQRHHDDRQQEMDSGFWGWLVVLGSFLTNGIIFGVINCYGVLFDLIRRHFFSMNDKDSEGNNDNLYTSCIGSFAVGMTFFCSFVASSLTRVIGIRKTAVLGGTLATCGLFAASFATSFLHIWLSYGVLFGVGASLSYTPSLVILGHYFDSRLGIVNGVVTAGSSIFSVLLSITLNSLVKTCSYREVMWILTGFMSLLILCGMTFIERSKCSDPRGGVAKDGGRSSDRGDKDHKGDDESISSSVWSNTLYLIWITGIPIGLFGYFVPYFTLVNYFKLMVPQVTPSLPITTMSVASGVGRILFGLIADLKGVNRILLQQIAFVSIGLLTFSLTCASNVYVFMVICLGLGLFDGCFITVLGPIAFDLVGREAAPQAVGFLLALCSLPLTVGPMVAGSIIDSTGSFAYAFFYAGIPPLIGAVIMIPVLLRSGRRGKSMNHEDHRHDSCSSNSSSLLQVIDEEDGRKRKGRTVVPSTQTSVTEIPGTPAEEDDLERGGNNLTVKNNNFFLTGNFTSSTCSDGDDDDQDDDGDQSRGVDHFLVDNNNKKSRDLL